MRRDVLSSFRLLLLVALSAAGITCSALNEHGSHRSVELRNLRRVEARFTGQANDLIRSNISLAKSETTFVNKKVYKDAVDETVYKNKTDKATEDVTLAQLQGLRSLINERVDEAFRQERPNPSQFQDLLNARVERDFVAQRILPPQASATLSSQ